MLETISRLLHLKKKKLLEFSDHFLIFVDVMMTFHLDTQLETDKAGKTQMEDVDFSFKYGVNKRENPADGIKDHKALLLLVPSPFKEMKWTIFPSCNSQGS